MMNDITEKFDIIRGILNREPRRNPAGRIIELSEEETEKQYKELLLHGLDLLNIFMKDIRQIAHELQFANTMRHSQ